MPGANAADGRRQRWQQHNEERRRVIIAAALALIEERPGHDPQVREIAHRAGLSRTVLYRHFEDRADLDRAVLQAIIDSLHAELEPAVSLSGTVPRIIDRIVRTYVGWAAAHPALHRRADQDPEGQAGPIGRGMVQLAEELREVIVVGLAALGGRPSESDAALLDPLAHALVGAASSAVRRWLEEGTTSPGALAEALGRCLWFVVDGHARTLGVVIDPERTVEDLVADVLVGQAPVVAP